MKKIKLIFALLSFFILFNCNQPPKDFCKDFVEKNTLRLDSERITTTKEAYSSSSNVDFYFEPYLIPLKFIYRSNGEIIINKKVDVSMPTLIGKFGVTYKINIKRNNTINDIYIEPNEYLIAIVDRKNGFKKIYKIEKSKKFHSVLKGKTKISASPGIVEIDVTDTYYQEIFFVDDSVYKIVNSNRESIFFTFYFKYDFEYWVKSISYRRSVFDRSYKYKFEEIIPVTCKLPPYSYFTLSEDIGRKILEIHYPNMVNGYLNSAKNPNIVLFAGGTRELMNIGYEYTMYKDSNGQLWVKSFTL